MLYVLVIDELQREFAAAQLAAAVARGMGADADIPVWAEVRAEFDTWLASEPEQVDAVRQTQLVALGLR